MMADERQITLTTWNKVAAVYAEKFMELDFYNESMQCFCELLPANVNTLLELGCGPGNLTRYLLQLRPDLNICAIDFAPNMIALAKTNNPSITAMVLDVRNLEQLQSRYHSIFAGFCIPYLNEDEVRQLLHNCANRLYPKGLVYFSFIVGDYAQSGMKYGSTGDGTLQYYYEIEEMQAYLAANNFSLLKTITVELPTASEAFKTHAILIAQRNAT